MNSCDDTNAVGVNQDEQAPPVEPDQGNSRPGTQADARPEEIGGPKGLEPTRYGDWERKGRCIDF
jgi:hypothetical protein